MLLGKLSHGTILLRQVLPMNQPLLKIKMAKIMEHNLRRLLKEQIWIKHGT